MTLEERLFGTDLLDAHGAFVVADLLDTVDQQERVAMRNHALDSIEIGTPVRM
jgi:hypothetical protein